MINAQFGGYIEIVQGMSPMLGPQLYLHIDQSSNMKNGEDDASILLTVEECKQLIGDLNHFIKNIEGDDYVVTKGSVEDLLKHPKVQETIVSIEINNIDVESIENIEDIKDKKSN